MSEIVTREQLIEIVPALPETRTFKPVPHIQLAEKMLILAQDILSGYTMVEERYTIARDGAQLFSVLTFTKGDDGVNFSVGYRNSTDKSLAIGIVMGASVIACSNLMFDGDIKILKRHTQNVWKQIEDLAITSFYRHTHAYDKILEDVDRLRRKMISDDQAASWFGKLFYRDVLSPRQLPVAVKEWKQPSFPEFEPRTAFSAYQAVTHALKSEPVGSVMEAHTQAHRMVIDI